MLVVVATCWRPVSILAQPGAAVKAKAMRLEWRAAAGLDPFAVHMQKLVPYQEGNGSP